MKQKIFIPANMRTLIGYGLAALAVLVALTLLAVPPSKYRRACRASSRASRKTTACLRWAFATAKAS